MGQEVGPCRLNHYHLGVEYFCGSIEYSIGIPVGTRACAKMKQQQTITITSEGIETQLCQNLTPAGLAKKTGSLPSRSVHFQRTPKLDSRTGFLFQRSLSPVETVAHVQECFCETSQILSNFFYSTKERETHFVFAPQAPRSNGSKILSTLTLNQTQTSEKRCWHASALKKEAQGEGEARKNSLSHRGNVEVHRYTREDNKTKDTM